jgi:hypothetical protein
MRYAYDMLGNRIHQLSMEAGARWMLNDVAGKPIRAWDSRGHNFTTSYDALRRPMEQTVRGTTATVKPIRPAHAEPRHPGRQDRVRRIPGQRPGSAEPAHPHLPALRFRRRRHQRRLDASGNPIEAYDFKGNLLRSTRRLVSDYKAIPDWRCRRSRNSTPRPSRAAPATTRSTAPSSPSRRTAA